METYFAYKTFFSLGQGVRYGDWFTTVKRHNVSGIIVLPVSVSHLNLFIFSNFFSPLKDNFTVSIYCMFVYDSLLCFLLNYLWVKWSFIAVVHCVCYLSFSPITALELPNLFPTQMLSRPFIWQGMKENCCLQLQYM